MSLSAKRPSTTTTPKPNQITVADIKADNPKTVRVNFNLTEQQRLKLKKYALEQDKTMTEVIVSFIDRIDER